MERIVHSVFNSIFQTKRRITTLEKFAVVATMVCVTAISAYVMIRFKA